MDTASEPGSSPSPSSPSPLQHADQFQAWFKSFGGKFHPDVCYSPTPSGSGFSILATSSLPSDTMVVSCPFALAITPEISKSALSALFDRSIVTRLDTWSERQLICCYICFHWITADPTAAECPSVLTSHLPYIASLPASYTLRTPLHFTTSELPSFIGTNLHGATLDRERSWRAEWDQCRALVDSAHPSWAEQLTWHRYLTASTYLSSRAFPSSLLSPTPSLAPSPTAYPVLLPGVDALNHARAQPVSWFVSHPANTNASDSGAIPSVGLILHNSTPCGAELFNNYGAKPNAELILGYGFALPGNPDDTILLRIGGASISAPVSSANPMPAWEVGRGARGVEDVWTEVLRIVSEESAMDETEYEDELEAADMLAEMAQNLLDRLPEKDADTSKLRPEVAQMHAWYVEGQRSILESIIAFARTKEASATDRAREAGVEVVFQDSDEEENESSTES